MIFNLKDIIEFIEGEVIPVNIPQKVKGFSIDSRTIEKGNIFIAVKGNSFDGHDFIGEALSRGAAAVILSERERVKNFCSGNFIIVKDTLETLGRIASFIRKNSEIPFICITGTNGKTTVKNMVSEILAKKYNVLRSKKSFNNLFGVALTLFELKDFHEIAVLEIGTNSPGEIDCLAEILKPDIGVITNIGYGHVEAFKDLAGVFREKSALLRHLSCEGLAVLNKDDDFLSANYERRAKTIYFGTSKSSDLLISDIKKEKEGYSFQLNGRSYFLTVCGRHNIHNAAAAVSVAEYLGVEYDIIKSVLDGILLPEMRLSKVKIGNILFVNDAYNANPSSFLSALDALKFDMIAGQKGIIAGDMLELGNCTRELHSLVGKKMAELNFDFFIALGKRASIMLDAAVSAGMPAEKVQVVSSHDDAAEILKKFAEKENTVVLLKGSRMSRMEDVIKCYTNYFTD